MTALPFIGGTVLLALGLDWLSKAWAERVLLLHEPVPIAGDFFQLTLSYNSGAAFGMFADSGPFVLLTSGIIIAVLVTTLARRAREGAGPRTLWPVGLMLGGSVANFLDRLPDGRVTDFLDVGLGNLRWPTFNLADSFIVAGMLALMYLLLLRQPAEAERA